MEDFEKVKPLLLDRTHTPRSASRAITLPRNFEVKRWLDNKSTCDMMDPEYAKAEIKRGKKLKILVRKTEKLKKIRIETLKKRHNSVIHQSNKLDGLNTPNSHRGLYNTAMNNHRSQSTLIGMQSRDSTGTAKSARMMEQLSKGVKSKLDSYASLPEASEEEDED